MEKITNRISKIETRLPWRDKYLERIESKNDGDLIFDFGQGFNAYWVAIDMLRKRREAKEADFYYTRGILDIVIPKSMDEGYYKRNRSGEEESIEDFYGVPHITFGGGEGDLLSNVNHDVYEIFVVYNHKYLVLHKTYDLDSLSKSPNNPNGVDAYSGELREDILKIADEIIKDLKENPNPETENGIF